MNNKFFEEMRKLAATRETGFLDVNKKDAYATIMRLPNNKWRAEVIQPIDRRGEVELFSEKPKLSQIPKSLRGRNVKRLF